MKRLWATCFLTIGAIYVCAGAQILSESEHGTRSYGSYIKDGIASFSIINSQLSIDHAHARLDLPPVTPPLPDSSPSPSQPAASSQDAYILILIASDGSILRARGAIAEKTPLKPVFRDAHYGTSLYAAYFAMTMALDPMGKWRLFIQHCEPCERINSVNRSFTTTSWEPCFSFLDRAIAHGLGAIIASIAGGQIGRIFGETVGFYAGVFASWAAGMSSFCECQIQTRYKTYKSQKWYGWHDLWGRGLRSWWRAYVYKRDPEETFIWALQIRYRYRIVDDLWFTNGWDPVPLGNATVSVTPAYLGGGPLGQLSYRGRTIRSTTAGEN